MGNVNSLIETVLKGENIDPNTPVGNLVRKIITAVTDYETELRKYRQAEGIAKAKARGVQFGAKPKISPAKLKAMRSKRASGVPVETLMHRYNLSRSSVYRLTGGTNGSKS